MSARFIALFLAAAAGLCPVPARAQSADPAWDAAIDVSGYVPRLVSDSARLLAGSIERYLFISTLAVYADRGIPDKDESAPLCPAIDASVEEITNDCAQYLGQPKRCLDLASR